MRPTCVDVMSWVRYEICLFTGIPYLKQDQSKRIARLETSDVNEKHKEDLLMHYNNVTISELLSIHQHPHHHQGQESIRSLDDASVTSFRRGLRRLQETLGTEVTSSAPKTNLIKLFFSRSI